MKKRLFKKCPSCNFKKCWEKASKCENCDYDFKLGRKIRPRAAVIEKPDISEDDEFAFLNSIDEKKPKEFKKTCPECGHMCWHAAPMCENCEWDFINKRNKKTAAQIKLDQSIMFQLPVDRPEGQPWKLEHLRPGVGFFIPGNPELHVPETWGVLVDVNFCAAKVRYIRQGSKAMRGEWSPATEVIPTREVLSILHLAVAAGNDYD